MSRYKRPSAAAIFAWLLCTLILLVGRGALALEPDEIALLVNSQVPAGRELAQFYAAQRHIPAGRIIELDVPFGEEIPFGVYEPKVAGPIRQWLEKKSLRNKIKCLVSFWGMPLRIGRRTLTMAEASELARLKKDQTALRGEVVTHVQALERSASELDPGFSAITGDELPQLVARLQAALNAILPALPAISDASARNARFLQLISEVEKLLGSARAIELLANPAVSHLAPRPPTTQELDRTRKRLSDIQKQMTEALGYDPDESQRGKVLTMARQSLGLIGTANVLSAQIETFRTEESESALDSELSLLWWHGYPRARWLANPLNWRATARQNTSQALTLMVSRLDGSSEQIVRSMITNSIATENQGLTGQVVIDARGKSITDSYGKYDQTLRSLNELIRTKTTLKVTFDDQEALIPAHSLTDPIALYCGWYSLRNYQPPGPFARGAVGFHVASFELVSLHRPTEHGWVRGLLSDGVCATLGPVAEPYLQSFPPADEFFPLLMTGKLTLAEVYWRTTPMVSWMQDCVGDPLYTPFKRNPPMKMEDLPPALRTSGKPGSG